ncbi:MAG: RNA polymerase subunit sigma-70, partial [Planctomycetota bacterium]
MFNRQGGDSMQEKYRCQLMRELCDQQVRFAPREKKAEQVDRAERLLREIDPQKTYSYEFVCFRVTGYRPEFAPVVAISGADLLPDLHQFIEDVSDAANLPADEAGEPVLTVEELSKQFNVSTKTISRWR